MANRPGTPSHPLPRPFLPPLALALLLALVAAGVIASGSPARRARTQGAQEVAIELVAEHGGDNVRALAVDERHVYVARHSRLVVFDPERPGAPAIGVAAPIGPPIQHLAARDGLVAGIADGLHLWDARDPRAPRTLAHLPLLTGVRAVTVVPGEVWLVQEDERLLRIDIADPSRPRSRGTWRPAERAAGPGGERVAPALGGLRATASGAAVLLRWPTTAVPAEGELLRLAPGAQREPRIIARLPLPAPGHRLAARKEAVLVLTEAGQLLLHDDASADGAGDLSVLGTVTVPGVSIEHLAYDGRRIWTAGPYNGLETRLASGGTWFRLEDSPDEVRGLASLPEGGVARLGATRLDWWPARAGDPPMAPAATWSVPQSGWRAAWPAPQGTWLRGAERVAFAIGDDEQRLVDVPLAPRAPAASGPDVVQGLGEWLRIVDEAGRLRRFRVRDDAIEEAPPLEMPASPPLLGLLDGHGPRLLTLHAPLPAAESAAAITHLATHAPDGSLVAFAPLSTTRETPRLRVTDDTLWWRDGRLLRAADIHEPGHPGPWTAGIDFGGAAPRDHDADGPLVALYAAGGLALVYARRAGSASVVARLDMPGVTGAVAVSRGWVWVTSYDREGNNILALVDARVPDIPAERDRIRVARHGTMTAYGNRVALVTGDIVQVFQRVARPDTPTPVASQTAAPATPTPTRDAQRGNAWLPWVRGEAAESR